MLVVVCSKFVVIWAADMSENVKGIVYSNINSVINSPSWNSKDITVRHGQRIKLLDSTVSDNVFVNRLCCE